MRGEDVVPESPGHQTVQLLAGVQAVRGKEGVVSARSLAWPSVGPHNKTLLDFLVSASSAVTGNINLVSPTHLFSEKRLRLVKAGWMTTVKSSLSYLPLSMRVLTSSM